MAHAVSHAGEEDVFAVLGPADGVVAGRMPGEAAGNASRGGNDVDIGAAAEIGGVGDLGAVRREEWAIGESRRGGEPLGFAAGSGNGPDVAGVAEGNGGLAEGGILKQQRRVGGCEGSGNGCKKHEGKRCKAGWIHGVSGAFIVDIS